MKKAVLFLVMIGMVFSVAFCVQGEEKKTLKVAISADFPPFQSYENDKLVGFDIDLMNYIGEKAGVNIEYVDYNEFDVMLTALTQGKADCAISAIAITDDREANFLFSSPYLTCNAIYLDNDGTEEILQPYGIAFPKELKESPLYEQIEECVLQACTDGTIEALAQKHQIQRNEKGVYEFVFDMRTQSSVVKVTEFIKEQKIEITLDGTLLHLENPLFVDETGRIQIPVRECAEIFEYDVVWNDDDPNRVGIIADAFYWFGFGETHYRKNETFYEMETSACLVNDRAYVPLRYLCESMGYVVEYEPVE